jgi:hypothetical protein
MAKTSAQILADFRKRHRDRGGVRLDLFLDADMAARLGEFANDRGLTRQGAIKELVRKAIEVV